MPVRLGQWLGTDRPAGRRSAADRMTACRTSQQSMAGSEATNEKTPEAVALCKRASLGLFALGMPATCTTALDGEKCEVSRATSSCWSLVQQRPEDTATTDCVAALCSHSH